MKTSAALLLLASLASPVAAQPVSPTAPGMQKGRNVLAQKGVKVFSGG
ncbi:MAG: hypothetical protein NTZ14_11890 [Hyphomicrobiales bacterium]|nr:hypothetical protein [Hyphomicrobiales bacterium]